MTLALQETWIKFSALTSCFGLSQYSVEVENLLEMESIGSQMKYSGKMKDSHLLKREKTQGIRGSHLGSKLELVQTTVRIQTTKQVCYKYIL
jgi:hypothetical protein